MISGVILTKNEENRIASVIWNLGFCEEVIVIDDGSDDNTVKIAKEAGAKVFSHKLNNDFSAQRNFGLNKAKHEWVLFVDADEKISKQLKEEILQVVLESAIPGQARNDKSGYYLYREEVWHGKKLRYGEWQRSKVLGKWGHNKLLRLGKKNVGVWRRRVHEYWDIEGKIGYISSPLIHINNNSFYYNLNKVKRWVKMHAQANFDEGKRASLVKIVMMPSGKFIVNYFVKLGFLDGVAGFQMAIIMSVHSFLAWVELWKIQNSYKKR